MSQTRHARLRDLFLAARERPAGERRRFLAAVRGSDAELCREVESLLAHDEALGAAATTTAPLPRGEGELVGCVLGGRYRLESLLGRGGMGEVYRAADLKLGVAVALKILPAELAQSEQRLALLLNEARLAREITHPNVCRIHDVGERDGLHFISMELVNGENLEALLGRGRLPRERAVDITRGLCAGLDAAHAQGILHHDLKPANLMIDERGEVRITDFGISLRAGTEGLSPSVQHAGTPAYMAPEQYTGSTEISVRTDLYAVGLVLYELFTGRRVFEAHSPGELERLHRKAVPTAPSALAADLEPALEKVILRCLEKNPRDRPASVRAVAAALPGRVVLGWRPAPGCPLPGRPHWIIDKKLGEGGCGEVWRAVHDETRERRVFKFCYEAARRRHLQREITLFRLLKEELGERDDIVRILGWSFDEAPFFIESEYTPGGNLEEWAEAQGGIGAVALDERLEILAQVATALAAAHSVGVLHKDVKPANVLIRRDAEGRARARLTDFGVGAVTERQRLVAAGITVLGMSEATRPGLSDTGGTRLYMAPEVLEGKTATIQADVYALGVMLYQVVVGDLRHALAPGWRRDVEDELLSEDIAAAVDGMPTRRLASAGELGRRLRALDERRVERAAEQRWRETLRRSRRRRRLATAAVAVLALFAVTVSLLALGIRREALRARGALVEVVRETRRAQDLARAAIAAKLLLIDRRTTWGNLVALEVRRPEATPLGLSTLYKALAEPVELLTLRHDDWVRSAAWSADNSHVLAACDDGTVWVWNLEKEAALVLDEHDHGPLFAAFSPDGHRVVTASADHPVRVWNAETGAEIARLVGHREHVNAVSWSPGGDRVLTASDDRTARIWSSETGVEVARLEGHGDRVTVASWSPGGDRVLTASGDRTARTWSSETGAAGARLVGHTGPVLSAAFSPGGRRVLTASDDGTARIWNSSTGTGIVRLAGHKGAVLQAVWSPGGDLVVTASGDGTARIWSSRTGVETAHLAGHKDGVLWASWSPDQSRIVTASRDTTARLWDVGTGVEILRLDDDSGWVGQASFTADGTRVLTASSSGKARIWSLASGAEIRRLRGHRGRIFAAAFDASGARVVTGSDDRTARVWDADTGAEIARLEGHTRRVWVTAFSPDGARVLSASYDGTARVWDAATGIETVRPKGHTARIPSAALSPDGRRGLSASYDGTARVWDTTTGAEIAHLEGHGGPLVRASWSPDGGRVVTASHDGTARVWDAVTGAETARLVGHTDQVWSALWNVDGARVVSCSRDRTARLWDAATGAETTRLEGHTDAVWIALFSPDGRRVLTASFDRTGRLWDVETGAETARLVGHTDIIYEAAFSPDGRRVVTAGDKTARIWDVETGAETARLEGHTDTVWSAQWSADGQRLLTGSMDKTARIWVIPDHPLTYLRARIRARTPLCLPAAARRQTLLERPGEAARRAAACRRCVPVFFERLGEAPVADWEVHVEAWNVYERCLAG